jgi:hypothetical protein
MKLEVSYYATIFKYKMTAKEKVKKKKEKTWHFDST